MKVYGLIGYPLTHSFSQRYFSEKFSQENIQGCTYQNFSIPSMDEFPVVLTTPGLSGLNVTIPYKEAVIPFLDETDEVVKEIGACNCIRIEDGKKTGYNTDVIGFERSLQSGLQARHDKALVLGTGGAAKAVKWVLKKKGIPFLSVSRRPEPPETLSYADLTPDLIASHRLIINTTPLGMYPLVEECPPIDFNAVESNHFLFDLIYNPETTRFLQYGMDKGATTQNGFDMLIHQAEESWKIWNNLI